MKEHFHNCTDGIHGQHVWKCFRPECKEPYDYECGLSADARNVMGSTSHRVEGNKPKSQRSTV